MEHQKGFILYNLSNEMYLGRSLAATSGDTHRWVSDTPLLLCENALDMLFNINSFIPRSRFPNMKNTEFNDHVKEIRRETKFVLSFLKEHSDMVEIMVVPIDVEGDGTSYDIDFVKAFKFDVNMV